MVPEPAAHEQAAGPRSTKGARTRARLLEAAKCVFERDGFLDARISDIADEAGVSYGSFYHYFTSKEEIFRYVARAQETQLDTQLDVQPDGHVDGAVGMPARERRAAELREQLASSIRRYLREYRAEARIMGVIEQVSRFDLQVYRLRFERLERFAVLLAASISSAQRVGAVDPSLDPPIVAHVLTATITRFAEAWFVQGQVRCGFEEGVRQLTLLACNALRLHEPASGSPLHTGLGRGATSAPGATQA
jgi:AcrR family transcriptional regulator